MDAAKEIHCGDIFIVIIGAAGFCFLHIGKDLLPKTNNGQLQLRLREPQGTSLEVTERLTKNVLSIIDSIVDHHVSISSAYVGIVPSSFGASNLYIFNSGTQEAVIQVNLESAYKVKMDELKERIRKRLINIYPDLLISFEPIELTKKSWRRVLPHRLKLVWREKIWRILRSMLLLWWKN